MRVWLVLMHDLCEAFKTSDFYAFAATNEVVAGGELREYVTQAATRNHHKGGVFVVCGVG